MFELLKKRIESKAYKLEKTLDLIDEMRVKEKITKEEADELYEFARTNAVAENSYAPLQKQLNYLAERLIKAENEIAELKAIINKEEPTEPVEEYPTYKQPQNALDTYKIGDKVTYQGKRYICKLDNCVWTPDKYPQAWELVEEIPEEFFEELSDELEDNTKENVESEG